MKKNQIASIPRRKAIERGAVALLLLLYVLLQAPTLPNAPWEGYDTWRQGDTYSVAVNYAQYSMHPLRPQFNYDGTADIVVQLELQLVPYLSALLFYDYEILVNDRLHGFGNALWWAWMNVTTVGAAIFPVTTVGKIICVLLPILGMAMFPIFTVYVTTLYTDYTRRKQEGK